MAKGINKVILIGNLGNDPDTRYMPQGGAVTNLSVATDESYKDKNGQIVPRTEWHKVVIFGKLAEIAKQYLRKGSKVYLEGRLQTRKWQDQSGQDRYSTEIVIDMQGTMQMLDGRSDRGGYEESAPAGYGNAAQMMNEGGPRGSSQTGQPPSAARGQGASSAPSYAPPPMPESDMGLDDDIPF